MEVKQRVDGLIREMRLELALMVLFLGLALVILALTQWFWPDAPALLSDINAYIGNWSIWTSFSGIILTLFGLYYVYDSLAKRKELRELLETDSKQVFLRNQERIEFLGYILPRSFERTVHEKRREFGLK